MPDSTEPVGFETDIKPMFRERDRNSMEFAFDLWSHDEVTRIPRPSSPASRRALCLATARGLRDRWSYLSAGSRAGNRSNPNASGRGHRRACPTVTRGMLCHSRIATVAYL
jgi:hypothetical protein